MLQPTADLGGRQQTLSGKELMVCAVTASSLLRHPWQSSASSLKLDELINEPGNSGAAASSIPVSFSRSCVPFPQLEHRLLCLSVPWLPFLPTEVVRRDVDGTGRWAGLWVHCHMPRAWEPGVLGLLKAGDSQVGQGELLPECWERC